MQVEGVRCHTPHYSLWEEPSSACGVQLMNDPNNTNSISSMGIELVFLHLDCVERDWNRGGLA